MCLQLTVVDRKIVNLMLQGASISDIAAAIKVKPRTVKAHLSRMYQRFGITSGIRRVKLAVFCYRQELYPDCPVVNGQQFITRHRDLQIAKLLRNSVQQDIWCSSN